MLNGSILKTAAADSARKIHSLSFLIPARRYDVNFDVIANQTLPAILECALMLILQLEQIAPAGVAKLFWLKL